MENANLFLKSGPEKSKRIVDFVLGGVPIRAHLQPYLGITLVIREGSEARHPLACLAAWLLLGSPLLGSAPLRARAGPSA